MTAGGSVTTSSPLPSAFGRYTLLERLAVGGMAEVFRSKIVLSHGFEKILVIKRILPHLAADRNFVSMFIEEAKLTAQLSHSKIVQILDFGEVEGQYFIALELIDGFARSRALAHLRATTDAAANSTGGVRDHGGARGAGLRAQRAGHERATDAHRPPRHLSVQHLHLEAWRREARRFRDCPRATEGVEDASRGR